MAELDEAVVERVARALCQYEWSVNAPDAHPDDVESCVDGYLDAARAVVRLLASKGLLCEPDIGVSQADCEAFEADIDALPKPTG